MKIGVTELLLIFAVALIVIGPDKLPAYAKKLGEALTLFRKATQDAAADIKESIVDPLEEAQKPLRDAVEPVREVDQAVRDTVKDVQDSFAGIGREKSEKQTVNVSPAQKEAEEKLPDSGKIEEE